MRTALNHIAANPEALASARRARRPMRHMEIEVRLDWRCNARCKFCGVWKYSREGMLDPERWRAVFTDLRNEGLEYVLFTGGEPLLYPHFSEVIEHVDALGIRTAIITNGWLLDDARVEQLARLERLAEVTVSLDSADPAVHDAVRKRPGLFARATRGMARLREAAPDLRLTVNTVVSDETAPSVDRLLDLPVLPDSLRVFPVGIDLAWLDSLAGVKENSWGEWASEARLQQLEPETWEAARAAVERLRDEAERRGVVLEFERLGFTTPFGGECMVPLVHFVVQPDGDVFPCCHVQDAPNRIGRLAEQSVAEMIAGEPYQTMLERLRPVSLRVCGSCSRYREFNERAATLVAGES